MQAWSQNHEWLKNNRVNLKHLNSHSQREEGREGEGAQQTRGQSETVGAQSELKREDVQGADSWPWGAGEATLWRWSRPCEVKIYFITRWAYWESNYQKRLEVEEVIFCQVKQSTLMSLTYANNLGTLLKLFTMPHELTCSRAFSIGDGIINHSFPGGERVVHNSIIL